MGAVAATDWTPFCLAGCLSFVPQTQHDLLHDTRRGAAERRSVVVRAVRRSKANALDAF